MPDVYSAPQPTPTNYQRTTGGNHLRWQPPTPKHLQEMLPAYEILSILGQGGMGAVYKGRQKSLDRIVAIKILPPEAGENDMQFVERFKNEARTMAKMNHPAIVHVYDFGETSEGQSYIVMEFIDGTDVAKMNQSQGKLPEDYALSITAHVCDALGYAHKNGIVHRDIKPANVLINMEGQVKVADFGLAKATDGAQMGLTKTNMAMGTPDFVSPEALTPGVPLDGRADLYAVGVMLYNMLTGTIPRGAFRMPSTTLQTDARFDKIIGKAMEMDRERRYQTALDLRRDLDVILTTPAAKAGGQTLPAQAALPQKPMGKSPSAPGPKPVTKPQSPAQQATKPAAGKAAPAPEKPKSKAPLFIGIGAGAVIGAGAFFMTSGKKNVPSPPVVAAAPAAPAVPVKVREEPKPESKPAASKPKPAPKPAAPARTVAAAASSGGEKWVDGIAKWFGGSKTHEGFTRKPEGTRAARFASMRPLPDSAPHMRDMAVRARVRFESAEENAHAVLSVRSLSAASYTLKIEPTKQAVLLMPYTLGNASKAYVEHKLPADFDFSMPHTLELRVVGDLLTAMLDGRKILEHRDTQMTAGHPALGAQKAWIESFEYVNLDPGGAAPATSPAPPLTRVIDLLSLVDVKRDAVSGEWKKTSDGIMLTRESADRFLCFDHNAPEEYDFEIEFTIADGRSEITQVLPVAGRSLLWKTATGGGVSTWCYFGPLLDEKKPDDPTRKEAAIKSARLNLSQRYRSTVEVRKGSLRALIDGREILKWSGDFKRMSLPPDSGINDGRHLGLGGYSTNVTFHKAELRPPAAVIATAPTAPAPKPAPAPAPPADPRLVRLEAGFQARYEADAQKPFLTASAALNQSYITNGLARARAAAQAKGILAEVTTLDAEKTAVEAGSGVPAEDAADTPESLKTLRSTYRGALAKITAERDARAAPLHDLYLKALDGYVAELTKAGKIEEAKQVQALRDAKAAPKAAAETATSAPVPAATTDDPVTSKISEREVAEWMLSTGAEISIEGMSGIKDAASMPTGRITITTGSINCDKITNADLARLSACREMTTLNFNRQFPDQGVINLEPIRKLTQLRSLRCDPPRDDVGTEIIAGLKNLTSLQIVKTEWQELEKFTAIKELKSLRFEAVSSPHFAALKDYKNLRLLHVYARPVNIDDADVAALVAALPELEELVLGVLDAPELFTDAALDELARLRKLKKLVLNKTPVSAAALEKLQKALPDCQVTK
jgi:hypothetical protein